MCGDDIPFRVTVTIPTVAEVTFGRDSTYSPDALVTSIRLPPSALDVIDRVRALIDPEMTRSMFIRQCAVNIAQAILNSHTCGDSHD